MRARGTEARAMLEEDVPRLWRRRRPASRGDRPTSACSAAVRAVLLVW